MQTYALACSSLAGEKGPPSLSELTWHHIFILLVDNELLISNCLWPSKRKGVWRTSGQGIFHYYFNSGYPILLYIFLANVLQHLTDSWTFHMHFGSTLQNILVVTKRLTLCVCSEVSCPAVKIWFFSLWCHHVDRTRIAVHPTKRGSGTFQGRLFFNY